MRHATLQRAWTVGSADRYSTCLPAGQIELYTHHPFLPTLVKNLQRLGMRTSAVYLLESQFMEDKYKFFRCVIGLLFGLLAQRFAYVYFIRRRSRWRRHIVPTLSLPCATTRSFSRTCAVQRVASFVPFTLTPSIPPL